MKRILTLLISLSLFLGFGSVAYADHEPGHESTGGVEHVEHQDEHGDAHAEGHDAAGHEEGHHGHGPAGWAVIPFVTLLLMIATGPLFFEHFWHHHYPKVAIALGSLVAGYYYFSLHDVDSIIHTSAEYIQFIALLAALFVAAGGIMIKVDKKGKPMVNVILLFIGAFLANFIGTTGASMLLVRPFIRLNKGRIKPYHILFFIFMVSNVGGSLTPIGDPPLFLGFLKGVPFMWTVSHNIVPWFFGVSMLGAIFLFFDSKNKEGEDSEEEYSGKVSIVGAKNFFWIIIVIAAVFLDPNVIDGVPSINMVLHGIPTKLSFVREIIMLSVAGLSFYFSSKEALEGNEFEFEPIKEVAYIFIGIFFTMIPALQLVSAFAGSDAGQEYITINTLYWLTGALSGVLDNAPTYVNFLTAAISVDGGSISQLADVKTYASGTGLFASGAEVNPHSIVRLAAISIASVFFGAMTYIGNAPNFMVKSIAEQAGISMPSFFGYVIRYSVPILLPILFLTWLIFIQFGVAEMIFAAM